MFEQNDYKKNAIMRADIILKYLNSIEQPILNKEFIVMLNIMPNAFLSYETNINHSLEELQKCSIKDYKMIDKLFFNIKAYVSIYLLDLEKLSYLWLIFFKEYDNSSNIIETKISKDNIHFQNNASLDIILLKILTTIKLFNINNKIIIKKDLLKIEDQISDFCETNNNLNYLINELIFSMNNNKNIGDHVSIMIQIYNDIDDLIIKLEFMHKALIKVVDYYNRKAY